METKMRISHKALWNSIELVENVKQSIVYIDGDINRQKLLNYLIRFFEVFEKFVDVYFKYKFPHKINRFAHDSSAELRNVCDCVKDVMKFVKVRVSVLLKEDAQANDIIRSMCFKAISRFQRYLVKIDFFNKEMFRKSALNLA